MTRFYILGLFCALIALSTSPGSDRDVVGVLLCLLSAAVYSVSLILQKPLMSRLSKAGACAADCAAEAVPVMVGTVAQKSVPLEVRAIGHVEAFSSVAVKARVGGQLTRVAFREGQVVKAGDVLVQRGTIHNWVNKRMESGVIAFVLISSDSNTAVG